VNDVVVGNSLMVSWPLVFASLVTHSMNNQVQVCTAFLQQILMTPGKFDFSDFPRERVDSYLVE